MTQRGKPIVAVVNMKGGVGKTTLSANVFYELSRARKKRVLLVDFDPQFNLSQLLFKATAYDQLKASGMTLWNVMAPPDPITVFDITEDDLSAVSDITKFISPIKAGQSYAIDLVPGDFRLATINLMEDAANLRMASKRFNNFLAAASTKYDVVVLDCNPSSSFMTRLAIERATHLFIPVRADRFSLRGLDMITEYTSSLPTVRELPIQIVVINDTDDTASTKEIIADIRSSSQYGDKTLVTEVRHSELLKNGRDYVGFSVDKGGPYSNIVRRMLAEVAVETAKKVGL